MTDIITSARVVVSQNALLLRDDDIRVCSCIFYSTFSRFLHSPTSAALAFRLERRVTKRRERKMRLLFCGKNFNGAKVILATTTRKTTTTMNLFSRRCCFCSSSSSARKCSPRTKIIIRKRGGGGAPQIRGCLLRASSSSYEPSKDNNSNNTNDTNAWELFYQTTDRTFSETDTICGNRSNEI